MSNNQTIIYKWRNQLSVIICVYGQDRCSSFRINIDECCRGEGAHFPTPSLSEEEKDKSKDD